MLTQFAKIGKKQLKQACGLKRESTKRIRYREIDELDRDATGCSSCPNFRHLSDENAYIVEGAEKLCKVCQQKKLKYVEEIKYDSEKAYKYRPNLQRYAILTFLFLHYADPDSDGTVKNINIKALADLLDTTSNTIKNCLKKMEEFQYIDYWPCEDRRHYNVTLIDYPTYHLLAKEGGTGYFTLSLEAFKEIIKIKDINQLRIALRTLLELDNKNSSDVKMTVAELQNFLPLYCKPGVITRAIEGIKSFRMLHHSIKNQAENYKQEIGIEDPVERKRSYKDTRIKFVLDPDFSFKSITKQAEETYEERLKNDIEKINHAFTKYNVLVHDLNKAKAQDPDNLSDDSYLSEGEIEEKTSALKSIKKFLFDRHFTDFEEYKKFEISDRDFSNIARHAVKFGYDAVMESLKDVYNIYINNEKNPNAVKLSALVLKFVRTHIVFPPQVQTID